MWEHIRPKITLCLGVYDNSFFSMSILFYKSPVFFDIHKNADISALLFSSINIFRKPNIHTSQPNNKLRRHKIYYIFCFPITTTSGPTRPNGWISIHVVGNLTSADGIPTIRWKSIQWMKIPPGIGWISHHLPQNGWMEIQPSLSHMAKLGGRGQKDVSNLLNLS